MPPEGTRVTGMEGGAGAPRAPGREQERSGTPAGDAHRGAGLSSGPPRSASVAREHVWTEFSGSLKPSAGEGRGPHEGVQGTRNREWGVAGGGAEGPGVEPV